MIGDVGESVIVEQIEDGTQAVHVARARVIEEWLVLENGVRLLLDSVDLDA